MKTQLLGKSSLLSSRLSYGNMRTVGTWNPKEVTPERMAKGVSSHLAAYEAGYTLFDTADIYCRGECEKCLGEALKQEPGMRQRIVIATKCGIRFGGDPTPDAPHRYDFSAEHIVWSCEQSLKRIGVETIDLYQLHRPDMLMNPAEIAGAFVRLREQGKVREFGVSNFLPSQVRALQSAIPFPLIVNQVEIHLGRLDPFQDGTLDQCLEMKMTPLSWSPLGGGYLGAGATVDPKHAQHDLRVATQAALDAVAKEHGISRTVAALAWLLKHPAGIIPIVGSNNPEHIRDAAKADDVELSREQWYRVLLAARGRALP